MIIRLHLGWIDIDYSIRKDEPNPITETSIAESISFYEKWERSNRLSVMFIQIKISTGIQDSVEQTDKVKPLMKVVDE